MKDFRLHLSDDTISWLEEHPEINVSKLAQRLVSETVGRAEEYKRRGPVFNVRFTNATWAAIIHTGRRPASVVRQLICEYIRRARRLCPGTAPH